MPHDDQNGGGYGRPPRKNQFQKGISGNPKGRPRKSKSMINLMERELDQIVPISEGGRETRLSKREVIVKRHVNAAMSGNTKAIEHLIRYCKDNEIGDPFEITEKDTAAYDAAIRRVTSSRPDEQGSQEGGEQERGRNEDNPH